MTGTKPFVIGLTGSMGMGKSTTADMFRELGAAVWDADAAVHKMYDVGGAAVAPLGALCPAAILDGKVDRGVLKDWIAKDDTALGQIEGVVHPLLEQDRSAFLAGLDTDIAVLDFPLLFEAGAENLVDLVVVVSAAPDVQRQRLLARGEMDSAMLETILAKQMPDAEKRARADRVIKTETLEGAREAVRKLISEIQEGLRHA
ncbi:MAG TPA: dephospho-CoA kinase [Aliiroseovarius sp.]|nr:dephospho-CoA kinase [Aliiroseovarius sp.]